MTPSRSRLFLFIAIGIAGYTFSAPLVRLAQLEGVPSVSISSWRMILTVLFLTPLLLRHEQRAEFRKLKINDLIWTSVIGACLVIYLLMMSLSLERIDVMVNQAIMNTSPLWVAMLEVIFFKVRFRMTIWIGLCLTLIGGVIIAVGGDAGDPINGENTQVGLLMAFTGALLLTLYMVFGRKIRPKVSIVPYMWLVNLSGAVVGIMINVLSGTPLFGFTFQAFLILVLVTFLAQILGHMSFNFALGYIPATFVSMMGQIVPVTSAVVAYLLFSQLPDLLEIIGSLTILVGITFVIRTQTQKRPGEVIVIE